MRNEIKLSKEQREDMINKIKLYFDKERDEEIGDLGASLLLDFIAKEIATEFYNLGVLDSFKYIDDRLEDVLSLQK